MAAEGTLTGGCLCGGVRFELSEPPRGAGYCHCTRCQRRTGTAASANAAVDGGAFRIVASEQLVKVWRAPAGGFEKAFCSECGAHLFSRDPEDHGRMAIRMGAFDEIPSHPPLRPSFRQFTAYAAAWEPIPDDGLERFPESRSA